MPTEPLAALVYVFLLMPGIAYVHESAKHRPAAKRSAFRETATVVVVSSVCNVLVLLLLLLVSTISLPVRTWLAAFISDPSGLFSENPLKGLALLLVFLVAIAGLGLVLGKRAPQSFLRRLSRTENDIEPHLSGWAKAFELMPNAVKRVSVQLKSGRWVSGELKSYNPGPDETAERSIVLVGKIWLCEPQADEPDVLEGSQCVVIQASEIDYLSVGYFNRKAANELN